MVGGVLAAGGGGAATGAVTAMLNGGRLAMLEPLDTVIVTLA